MSYILDALRKSEAARRSREAPDLLAQTAAPLPPMPADRAPKGAGRPAWAVVALGVSALAVALWLRFTPAGDAPADAGDTSRDAIGPAGDIGDTGSVDTGALGAGETSSVETSSVETSPVETSPVDTPEPGVDAGNLPGTIPGVVPGTIPGTIPGMAPVIGPAAAPPPAQTPSIPAASTPAASIPSPPTLEIPPASRPASPPSAAVASASPASNDGRPVALADIAPDLRRQLPPLRMSMHLWNEAPERRLLVLDGQRLRQGDVIGEVVVERIDRNGAVLAWRGARILLPAE